VSIGGHQNWWLKELQLEVKQKDAEEMFRRALNGYSYFEKSKDILLILSRDIA
jgi:hypothetical protein